MSNFLPVNDVLCIRQGVTNMVIMTNKIEKVLFDLDGTLFDTQKLHARVEAELLLRYCGITIDPNELSANYAGWPTRKVFQLISGCDDKTAEELCVAKWSTLMPLAKEAEPLADLHALFHEICHERKIDIAIGTASPRQWAIDILSRGWIKYFHLDAIIGGDMVKDGKPHPEIWLRAANITPPRKCLVVEDGSAGIEAAEAAGMPAALLTPKTHPHAHSIKELRGILPLLI